MHHNVLLEGMHELSIVMRIVDMAREQVQVHSAAQVEKIELEIGSLAGIEMDAFDFAWEQAIVDSVLSRAERIIHPVQARANCTVCTNQFEMDTFYQPCPTCGSFRHEVVQGKELKLKSLTLL